MVRHTSRITSASPQSIKRGGLEDHHGGGAWAWENDDPEHGEAFLMLSPLGVEWAGQFCLDAAKLDRLRMNARRFYSMYPRSAERLGIRNLLDTPITDAAGIARWVDSILNASVPLTPAAHTGRPGGIHHCPKPIADIALLKRDDFVLFPTKGTAVAPIAPRGSGDGRVRVVHSSTGRHREGTVLSAKHPLARRAFAKQ